MAEFWSNNDRGYRIRLWIDQTSQNIAGNSSQVRVRVALLNTTTTFAGYTFSGAVTVDGHRLNYSGQPSMTSYNQTISLIDQTITVSHGSDGKKSVGFNASFSGSGGYSPGTLSLSGNFGLTTIPRTSSFSGQTVAVGSSMSIAIKRASSSFTHTLRYGFGSKSGTIATGVATSTTWAVPINFAEEIPNGTSAQGTIWCDTYSGNTKIGTSHYIFTVTVPDTIKPTFSGVTLTDINSAAKSLLTGNNFLQIISNIQVDFNGAVGAYGSTITGYKAEIVNRNLVTNSNGGTLGIMNFNGSATIRASVVDSRGRQSDTKDITINVIEYFAPILSFTALRTRENPNTIQIVRNAKIAPISISGSMKNVMTLKFKVTPFGRNTYTADNGMASGSWTTQHTLNNSAANMAGNYLSNKSYTIVGTLSDKFTSTEFATTVATESVVMSYDKDGRVGIGKVVEQGKAGSLDVAGDIYAGNKPIQQLKLTNNDGRAIYAYNADVNLQVDTGIRWINPKCPNSPFPNNYGFIETMRATTDIYQIAREWHGEWRVFRRNAIEYPNNTKWTDWVDITNIRRRKIDWTSAGVSGSYYKVDGDVLTVKYSFRGTGADVVIANIPSSIFVAPQSYMKVIARWAIDGGANTHVQINAGSSNMIALRTANGENYVGQLTIML